MGRGRNLATGIVLVLLVSRSATAQEALPPQPSMAVAAPQTYGTTALSIHTIFGSGFQSFTANAPQYDGCCHYWFGDSMSAPLSLPSGAVIDHIDLEACDADPMPVLDVVAFLVVCVTNGACTTNPNNARTSFAPGCVRVASAPMGVVVDNEANSYLLQVNAPLAEAKFRAVRVYYRLQVSPAPATATFTDVPVGHLFHRFVEALVASGITAGCGGGNYCVDNPISRGEMAVFLSVALGLHFAP